MIDDALSTEASADALDPRPITAGANLPRPGTFHALRHRNFRLFMAGQLISFTGTWMEQTAMGWLVYRLTGSSFLLGVVAASSSIPMLLFAMWGGSLADQFPKRKILVVTQSAAMIFAFSLAALVWWGHVQPWQIVLIALFNGTAMAFDLPARQAFIIETTGRDDLLNAISINSSVFNGARVVGPAIAGVAVVALGAAPCFFLNGVSFIAVIIGLLMMRIAPQPIVAHHLTGLAHALSGLKYVWNHTRVLTILSLFAVVIVFGWSYIMLMPAIAVNLFGASARGYGALMSSIGFGALIGSLVTATIGDRYPARAMAFGGLGLFSVTLLLFSVTRTLAFGVILQAAAHLGMILFLATSQSTLQRTIGDEMQGRVMGVWSLVMGAMMPLGNLGAGLLASRIGIPHTITLGATVCGAAGLITLFIVRRRDAAAALDAFARPPRGL